ncbi:Predicted acyltransferase [Spirosomataceae bacterium TFI 002]|nr:Predicted acyltransferase [Spirosomataceae bacterium TFI 002]
MNKRLLSVDVFRGLTIMLMTVVNNAGDWANIYPPFRHAEWHGCTPTDLVFPFFLFIMGVAVPLSGPIPIFTNDTMGKILTRTFRIFGLGFFLSYFTKIQFFGLEGTGLLIVRLLLTVVIFALLLGKYDKKLQFYVSVFVLSLMFIFALGGFESFSNVRILGVLQRIAIVYFFVSLLYYRTSFFVQAIVCISLLLIYWFFMALVPAGEWGAGLLEPGKNFAAWLDAKILGEHMYAGTKTWDPEGVFSTIPAISTGLLGVLTGQILIKNSSTIQKAGFICIAGIVLIVVGWVWGLAFPINKALWTSSFVLFTAGLALFILGLLYFLIDHLNWKSWTKPFAIFGVNPMLVFFASGIIPRALGMINVGEQNLQSFIYTQLIAPNFSDPSMASLVGALIYLFIWFLILLFFHRRKLIFKV